jgi:DNA-binding MarR family transcriptional regulator
MSSGLAARNHLVDAVFTAWRSVTTEIDRVDQLAAERFGVNRTDLRVLELIGTGGAQAPTALADTLGYTTGGITTVLDRLERAGYVRRRPDPRDRRRLIIEGTPLLTEREGQIFGELMGSTRALIASYSDAELTAIRDFLERARSTFEAHDRASVGTPPSRAERSRVKSS